MLQRQFPYITSNENILGGIPVIKGTRVPVERLIFLLETGYTEDRIKSEYPQLSFRVIRVVLSSLARMGYKSLTVNGKRKTT